MASSGSVVTASSSDASSTDTATADGSSTSSLTPRVEKALLFQQRVYVTQCPDLDHLVHYLNSGAAQVVLTSHVLDIASATLPAQLTETVQQMIGAFNDGFPVHRISLPVNIQHISEDDKIVQALQTLTALFTDTAHPAGLGLQLTMASTQLLKTNNDTTTTVTDSIITNLKALAKKLGEFRLTVRLTDAPSPALVQALHARKIHVVATVAPPTASTAERNTDTEGDTPTPRSLALALIADCFVVRRVSSVCTTYTWLDYLQRAFVRLVCRHAQ